MKKLLCSLTVFIGLNLQAQTYGIYTIAGTAAQGYTGDGGAATLANISQPADITVDAVGNVYFTDLSNHVVRKINTSGIITTIAGNGTMGYSGNGGAATSAQLRQPYGVAVDAVGNVYIAERLNHVVRKVDLNGVITLVAGTGIGGYNGDGGLATSAQIDTPYDVSIDASGNIYIAGDGHRIRKIDVNTGVISTIAGTGVQGYSGDGGLATSADLSGPSRVFINTSGIIYFSDRYNNRVRKIDENGIITTVAGTGTAGFNGNSGIATSMQLYSPYGVTEDAAGNIYIADFFNDRLRKVDVAGNMTTLSGMNFSGYNGDNQPSTSAWLSNPNGIALGDSGKIYIADINNNRIRVLRPCASNANISATQTTICAGTSVTLTASGMSNYNWSTLETSKSISVTPIVTTVYSHTNTCGIATTTITVNQKPNVSASSGSICLGQSFTIVPSGADTYTYSSGSSTVTPTANATYTVTGADVNGCLNTAVSTITVNSLPTVSANSGSICSGQSFTIVPSGADTYSYSSGSDVVMPTSDVTYTVTGTDANGCENMATSTVSVNALPVIAASTSNTLLCVGQTATLSVTGADSYVWSTTETTSDISVSPTVQTTYTVVGTDVNGCENLTSITQDVSTCTSINELNSNFGISVYPNPFQNTILVSTDKNIESITVIDVLGKIVLKQNTENQKTEIDLSHLKNGIYYIQIQAQGKTLSQKIIKQ